MRGARLAAATVLLAGCVATALAAVAPARIASTAALTGGIEATPAPATSQPPAPPVGLAVLSLVDRSRTIRLRSGRVLPRTLLTYVRYPALGALGQTDVLGAPPALAGGPYPLVVFAPGFDVAPRVYAALLQSWASAGYVVAAPVFPRTSPGAPGGLDEEDVVNQPADVSFLITSLLAAGASATGPLAGLINPGEIAVAGHSDGGETALAVAYARRLRDPRIDAAMVFSGAEISGVGGYSFAAAGAPPLLAAQGTADRFNEPRYTNAYFKHAQRPKYLLRLLGAGHLPPFSSEQPQLGIVERVSVAFLDLYLKREPGALPSLLAGAAVSGTAALAAQP